MINSQVYNQLLKKLSKDNVLLNESMKKHTSFKIGGNADAFIKAKTIDEIKFVLKMCQKNNIPLTIIGNGSNLLVKDNGIQGIVLKIDIDKIEIDNLEKNCSSEKYYFIDKNNILDKSEKYAIVTVGAGVLNGKLSQILLKKLISGFEFASGIPGTIGGAVKMNAGAYGSEMKDIVVETTCIDINGNILKLNNEQQMFKYRGSIFKDKRYVILESKLLLKYDKDSANIKEKMEEYKKIRLEKQPIKYPSAGSTFKRGNDYITAELIDKCGLKGYSIGGAQISTKHAGFIINTGNATAEDVINLIDFIKKSVFEKFEKNIELEVEVVGK